MNQTIDNDQIKKLIYQFFKNYPARTASFEELKNDMPHTITLVKLKRCLKQLAAENLLKVSLNVVCPICKELIEFKPNYFKNINDECPHCGRTFELSFEETCKTIYLLGD